MVVLQNVSYIHPGKDLLFENINLTINKHDKVALIGNNGVGKSTLLKIIAGALKPSRGTVILGTRPYYIPQLFGQFNEFNIAEVLNVKDKLKALKEILDGKMNETNLAQLGDDWAIEERCEEALAHWQLDGLDLKQKLGTLSGGQKTKIFLAGISIHQPRLVLMDEPGNHLDTQGRHLLNDFVQTTSCTLVMVSHDRKLLDLVHPMYELSRQGITIYGGNYHFYAAQKTIENKALNENIRSKESMLRKAKEIARKTVEKKQKRDARGKKKQAKAGLPAVAMNALKNKAEKGTAQIKGIHAEKVGSIRRELTLLRRELPGVDKMKFGFNDSALHHGKVLVHLKNVNFGYSHEQLWKQPVSFMIKSGERMAVRGANGSGKTTLMKIILGKIKPQSGSVWKADAKAVYIDQDYSLIDDTSTVFEQVQRFNSTFLQEHEIKIRLNRFLFVKDYWDKPCSVLSGGEKMRLMLCSLNIANQAPDMIILDEPTNNLDIQNMEILTAALIDYRGTLVVISHDEYFLEQINVNRTLDLM